MHTSKYIFIPTNVYTCKSQHINSNIDQEKNQNNINDVRIIPPCWINENVPSRKKYQDQEKLQIIPESNTIIRQIIDRQI